MLEDEAIRRLKQEQEENPLTGLEELRETVAKSWVRSRLKKVSPRRLSAGGAGGTGGDFQGTRAVNRRPVLFEYIFS